MLRYLLAGLTLGLIATPTAFAAKAQIAAEAFFKRPLYSSVTISPDGKYLALIGPVKGDETQTQMDFYDLDANQVKGEYVLPEQQQVSNIWWLTNDRVVFTSVIKTGSFDQPLNTGLLWQVGVDGNHLGSLLGEASTGRIWGTVFNIPRDQPGHIVVGGWGGATVLDATNFRQSHYVRGLGAPEHGWPTLDNNENIRLVLGYNEKDAHPEFFTHPQGTKTLDWTDATEFLSSEERWSSFGPIQFTADDSQFYYEGATPGGTLGLYVVDAGTLKKTLLYSDPGYDIDYTYSDTAWMDGVDGKTLVAFQYQAELPQWIVVKKDASEVTWLGDLQNAFPGEAVRITSTTWDGRKMLVYVYSDKDPGQYFLYDTKTQKAQFLFSVRPDINPDDMAEMKPVTFKSRDGLTIHGYLTLPKGGQKNLPLIVHPHGGPIGIRDIWGFDPEVQFLAYHGYAVLQVNYRGSGGYGAAFQRAGYQQWGGTMQDDLTDATHWAVDQGIADPKRICIYGASYGGYASLEGVEKEPDLYRCAVGYAGVYDLVKLRGEAGYIQGQRLKPYMHATLGDDDEILKQYSPYLHVDKIKAALFLAHGGADHTADPSHADELRDALDKIKKPYEWVYYPKEGHGFYALDHQVDLYNKMLAFFDQNIGQNAIKPATSAGQ
ncbi:MAG TPA: S9 family peptidase [Gammaproteobacteria bacterium]|jgi:dipeptidyl aminopeptidase/acylaminoacyl peptidase